MKLVKELGFRPVGSQGHRQAWGLYLCECGKYSEVVKAGVNSGNTKSCGCRINSFVHGLSGHELYRTWVNIKSRCYNKKNKSYGAYGGRGISVCKRWRNSLPDFIKDMGKKPSKDHSIDRINNNKNYTPANCRWSTQKEQQNNKRSNVIITQYGVTQTRAQWADTLEVPIARLDKRFEAGWSCHDALFLKKNERRNNNGNKPTTKE